MKNGRENQTHNGWQNTGFFMEQEMLDELSGNELKVYRAIVINSVKYGQPYTNSKSVSEWCKQYGMKRNTWIRAIQKLEEKGLIKKKKHKGFIDGGGSKPLQYGVVFPKNFNVWLKDKRTSQGSQENPEEFMSEKDIDAEIKQNYN